MSEYDTLHPLAQEIVDRNAKAYAEEHEIPFEQAREILVKNIVRKQVDDSYGTGH